MRAAVRIIAFAVAAATMFAAVAEAQTARRRTPANKDARAVFIGLADGAVVPSRFTVKFATENFDVAPTTEARANAGHFHILIDRPPPPADAPIPSDPNHLHFGKGQQEGEIILAPGEHTLQLVMGDHDHVQHDPPVLSAPLRVRVDAASVEKPREAAAPDAAVFFVGLDDGATIPTRSVVRFGARNIEIAPAGAPKAAAGHHHLIIDSPQPDLDREIPADPNHLHFGRGQTEMELTLTPGPHTLQLVLGDHAHVPHDPPVMSKRIRVTAVEGGAPAQPAASAGRTPSPPDAAVYFVYPTNGATIYPNSTIRFGLRNMGVAPAGIEKPNTGHHHLLIDVDTPALDKPLPADASTQHFGLGQTEKKITLTPGKHRLQLILGDHRHVPHDPPVMSERIEVTVSPPRKKRKRYAR